MLSMEKWSCKKERKYLRETETKLNWNHQNMKNVYRLSISIPKILSRKN